MVIPYSRTIVGELPWYSVLIVCGIVLAIWLAGKEEVRLGLPKDTTVDLALVTVPCGIVGARLYYVMMSWESFAHQPLHALFIWEGGLAIYGAVIGGAAGAAVYAKRKKISFLKLADMIAPGLLLAQGIGRWGNYFNMEAFGPPVTEPALQFFPLAVLIPSNDGYVWHAATFFYESVWNLAGFSALWLLRKKQKHSGNVFVWYLLIYGAGRFVIEQLRMDSLYIGSLRASQYLSLVLCAAAGAVLLRQVFEKNKTAFFTAAACGLLWLSRWMLLGNDALYTGALLFSGAGALWLKKKNRTAVLWLAAAVLIDGTGLLAARMAGLPLVGAAVHALLCSASLPVYVYALCMQREIDTKEG